jgi:hypothetical protein
MNHAMPSLENTKRREIDGIIRQVDAVNRDMTVLAGARQTLVDVPSDCSIVLNGETVKLRLLQPGDPVRVTYVDRNNVRLARWIEAGNIRSRAAEACRLRMNGKDDHE